LGLSLSAVVGHKVTGLVGCKCECCGGT
jgi:hypothetical protein